MRTRDSIADVWGDRTPYAGDWPVRVDQRGTDEPDRWVQSACVLCSMGCGIDIGVKDGRMVAVRGRAADRANRGRLGPKGLHGWEANGAADRLTRPLLRRRGKLEPASWDEAMGAIVTRSEQLLASKTSNSMAFYTSGQLFLEEYYTLALIGKAGLGTPHMDGNTRLCTATAAAALRESFGADGQPGTLSDIDTTDALFVAGHNPASQQTVMWMRVLDRLAGPNPPRIVVVDPRTTATALKASVHLSPRLGTNVALMNGLLHLIVANEWIDRDYIERHAQGFYVLERTVKQWTPKRTSSVTEIPVALIEEAAEILGTAPTLVSTVLQGVYQSMQATAAACQVNNLHIIRGMLGRPGCGLLQMNGQPTSQNTRETGADGEFPGFFNWSNPDHMDRLAAIWNVEPQRIPHWSEPTHAMQIFRYCEQGAIEMLWISATNPVVSLPDAARIRRILRKRDLLVIVQDAYMTETAEYADIVLPAAIWGEKTGTYTNTDRTVHVSHQAIDPPGEARSDFAIFVDYARRMGFRDKDGAPLVGWSTPQEAFEAWKRCSAGRPCDYSGMSYESLSGGSGIQWPCTADAPGGTERLYADGEFMTAADACETYGHDLATGAQVLPDKYKAYDPAGKALIKAADYRPPDEEPDQRYPFWLTTGRIVYHFHTRTKTGRSKALNDAAPEAFVELAAADAERLGIRDGDMAEVRSRRGRVVVRARVAEIKVGTAFIPFHYGSADAGDATEANELTMTAWDPVSKQPYLKFAAVAIRRV
jgi:anaerobic selenocysteine-containing dehydrogenase